MIETKTCTRCKAEKPRNCFHKRAIAKDGLMSWCKECCAKWAAEYYTKNKAEISRKHKAYNASERGRELARRRMRSPEVREKRRLYAEANKDEIRRRQKEYYEKNKNRIRARKGEYQRKNKDKVRRWHKKYRETHREQIAASQKEYAKRNREAIRRRTNERLHNDDLFKAKEQTRNMVRTAIRSKGHVKTSATKDIIGMNLDDFFEYLKKTWEKNYGTPWSGEPFHIDHIVPLATAKTKKEVEKLCHYTNLQMLTPLDNMLKHDKLDWNKKSPSK